MRAVKEMCLYTFSTWTKGLNKDVNNINLYVWVYVYNTPPSNI